MCCTAAMGVCRCMCPALDAFYIMGAQHVRLQAVVVVSPLVLLEGMSCNFSPARPLI